MSKKKEEVQPKNNGLKQFIYFMIILIVVFGGLVAYGKYKAEKEINKDTYNNYNFQQDRDGIWFTNIQIGETLFPITFYNHPIELEDVIVEEKIEDTILRNRPEELIIALPSKPNPLLGFGGRQISKITEGMLGISTIPMLNEPEDEIPYVICEREASASKIIISFESSNKNLIHKHNENPYCIILEFNEEKSINESLKVADAFSYHLLKIM